MNTTNQNWVAAVVVALGLCMTGEPMGRAQAEEPAVRQESAETLWAGHLLANCPTNTTVTEVAWKLNGSRIEFVAKVSFDAPRYVRVPFFPETCTKQLAQLREAVLSSNQPIECQREGIRAGEEREVSGSFARRIDGKFATVVWGDLLTRNQPFNPALPAENSAYSQMMRDKIQEVKTRQAAEGFSDFVATLGKLSSTVGTLTGNGQLNQWGTLTESLTQLVPGGTNATGGTPASSNSAPAKGSAPLAKAVESGVGTFRALGNLVRGK